MLNIIKLYKIISDILNPYYCFNCIKFLNYGYLCNDCLKKLNFSLYIQCPKCKKRKPLQENFLSTCCSNLIKSLISFSEYSNEVISKLIKLGKFDGYWKIFEFFGFLISENLKVFDLSDFQITFVPLDKKSEIKRRFNQSKIIAEVISKDLNISLFEGLIKIRETKMQIELSEKERFENIKGAFGCLYKTSENIIIIDDIMTTGATLFECAKVLRENGAKNIVALTILN